MWDLAPQFGAMIVFAEHRYYGESMPYGWNESVTYSEPANLRWLTAEQALADFAELILVRACVCVCVNIYIYICVCACPCVCNFLCACLPVF
jgi:hypothetical protein